MRRRRRTDEGAYRAGVKQRYPHAQTARSPVTRSPGRNSSRMSALAGWRHAAGSAPTTGPRSVLTPMPMGAPASVPRSPPAAAEPVTLGHRRCAAVGQPLGQPGGNLSSVAGQPFGTPAVLLVRRGPVPRRSRGRPRAAAPVPAGFSSDRRLERLRPAHWSTACRWSASRSACSPAARFGSGSPGPGQSGRGWSVRAGRAVTVLRCRCRATRRALSRAVSGLPGADRGFRGLEHGCPLLQGNDSPGLPRCSSCSAGSSSTCPRLRAGPKLSPT